MFQLPLCHTRAFACFDGHSYFDTRVEVDRVPISSPIYPGDRQEDRFSHVISMQATQTGCEEMVAAFSSEDDRETLNRSA